MNHSGEVSKSELDTFKDEFGRKIDDLLPRVVRLNGGLWGKFYELYRTDLIPFMEEIIRREREVRDKILSDMQKDSVAYEEGYAEGAEAMRKEALRILFECDRVDPVYGRIKAATVDPPSRR